MRAQLYALKIVSFFLIGLGANHVLAEDQTIEEVVVTASFIDESASEIANPLHIVNGQDIKNGATLSLGATLKIY